MSLNINFNSQPDLICYDLIHCGQNADTERTEHMAVLQYLVYKICQFIMWIWEGIKSLFSSFLPQPKTIDFAQLINIAAPKTSRNVVTLFITPCLDAKSLIQFALTSKTIMNTIPYEHIQKAQWAISKKLNFINVELPLDQHVKAYNKLTACDKALPPDFIDYFGLIDFANIPHYEWDNRYYTMLPAPMIRSNLTLAVQYRQNTSTNPEEFVEVFAGTRDWDSHAMHTVYRYSIHVYKNGQLFQSLTKIKATDVAKRFLKLLKHEPVGSLSWPLQTSTHQHRSILEIVEQKKDGV